MGFGVGLVEELVDGLVRDQRPAAHVPGLQSFGVNEVVDRGRPEMQQPRRFLDGVGPTIIGSRLVSTLIQHRQPLLQPAKSRRRDGRTVYRVRLRDPDGNEYLRTFSTKKAAKAFEDAQRTDRRRGAWVDPRQAMKP